MPYKLHTIYITLIALLCTGLVLANEVATPKGVAQDLSLEEMVTRAEKRAEALRTDLTGFAPQPTLQRAQAYQHQAIDLNAGNQDRIRRGAGFLSPEFQIDPYVQAKSLSNGVIYIAVSLSMPAQSLRALARDAEKANGVLVIRGLKEGSFKKTQIALKKVFVEGEPAGLIIDPRVFETFHIERVPSFIATPNEVAPCEEGLDCVRPEVAFDVVRGNISLKQALSLLADQGMQATDVARQALRRMEP